MESLPCDDKFVCKQQTQLFNTHQPIHTRHRQHLSSPIMSPAAQYELPDPPKDSISSISYAPDSPTLLLVSSWDSNLYLYDASPTDPKLLRTFPHRAPILSACFGDNDNEAFTACMDWSVRRIDFETGEMSVLSTHIAPVRSVAFDKQNGIYLEITIQEPTSKHLTCQQAS